MLAGRHDETFSSLSSSSSFVPIHSRRRGYKHDGDGERCSVVGNASERRISLVWKRGWMVVVLIEIGLREISQRDAGEVAGERSGEQVSSKTRPRIRLGLPG